jgi:hypothetical protein
LSATRDQPLRVEAQLGDVEDLRSLMLDFRKLVAEGEDANFYAICNVVEKGVTDASTLEILRGNRAAWKAALRGDAAFNINGTELQGLKHVEAWNNGVLFHGDS